MTNPKPTTRPADDPRNTLVMLRKELLASGESDRSIARLVRANVLHRVRRGAYVDASAWHQLDDVGQYGLLGRAVVKQAKTDVVLSHLSGLPEYDVPMWGLDLTTAHVTRRDGRAGRREAGVEQHCGLIRPGDVVQRNGVDVMDGTRLAIEVTIAAETEPALVAVNRLLHERHTTLDAIRERYASMGEWPGSLRTDLVLRLADSRLESVGEDRTFFMCFQQHLPTPIPQYEIKGADGKVFRLDFAWPELGVFLEFDGKAKYQKFLKPGESVTDVVLREKQREELICRITGWRCIRITWADLEHPARTAAMIREVLAQVA